MKPSKALAGGAPYPNKTKARFEHWRQWIVHRFAKYVSKTGLLTQELSEQNQPRVGQGHNPLNLFGTLSQSQFSNQPQHLSNKETHRSQCVFPPMRLQET